MTSIAVMKETPSDLVQSFERFCSSAGDLPHPGAGRTLDRWRVFADLSAQNLSLVKIAEAHADALSILAECDMQPPARGTRWAVWAANPPNVKLEARRLGDTVRLSGTKAWCSGAALVTHALVTCLDGDVPLLARVEIGQRGISIRPSTWANAGMAAALTTSIDFRNAEAKLVGVPGVYVERPGFWQGAIGIAACWHGAAIAIARPLLAACVTRKDAHAFAHLGAIQASLSASASALREAAGWIDAYPTGAARRVALTTRAVVEQAATETIQRAGRALGANPLCMDAEHAQRVADLTVFMRQSHAEHDLEALGQSVQGDVSSWQL